MEKLARLGLAPQKCARIFVRLALHRRRSRRKIQRILPKISRGETSYKISAGPKGILARVVHYLAN
jgi:hypothetical protein